MKVSEKISYDDIQSWTPEQLVTIQAGTGSGKSHFIKNKLYNHATQQNKKILMLVSRSQIKQNFEKEIQGKPNIDIITYQKLEHSIKQKGDDPLQPYDYIVCDEFHYFLSDDFNRWIDLSFYHIVHHTDKVRIFMSATGSKVSEFLRSIGEDIIPYSIKHNYSHVKKLSFFYKEDAIKGVIQDCIQKNKKAMVFVESAQKAYELHQEFSNHSLFNCSKQSPYYTNVDKNKVNRMLEDNKFDDLILITTRVMDTGVNVIDSAIDVIVTDVMSTDNIIQCIGRKRIDESVSNDTIHVYIKARGKKRLNFYESVAEKKVEESDYAMTHTKEEFINKYRRENLNNNVVSYEWNDGEIYLHINKLNHHKAKLDLEEIKDMKNKGYCKYVAHRLGKRKYQIMEEVEYKSDLYHYLSSMVGIKIQGEQKEELIDRIDHRVNYKKMRGYSKLNKGLEMINIPFMIVPKRTKQERYWTVQKIDNS